ncbi:MAG: hypothetical protein RL013_454 [Bacteroidota bacterium]|jgi:uncharacterized protein (DUF433 family)
MSALYNPGPRLSDTVTAAPAMKEFASITIHPEVQDGEPVFSGTRIRVETFFDYMRIGVSVNEFLDEFPSITRDQAMEVYSLIQSQYTLSQIAAMITGPQSVMTASEGRIVAAA